LHEVVSETDMARVLARAPGAEAASRELVEAARAAHARDDATAVAVRLDGTPSR
jgi:serine/threonine protein phosphatase PrpC